ncbi:MAG: zinc-dependent metalloprotease, partial [Bacteroidota bacterium]
SNDIGLDRGQLGNTRVVKFTKMANKIMLIQPNYSYRAESDNVDERRSVEEAFAKSIIWGFNYTSDGNGGYTIDLTDFLLRDAHGVASRLSGSREGNYSVDKSRSALYFPRTKNFPDNTEFESVITFRGSPKGRYLSTVTPTAQAVTVRMHHSFVRLPDNQYEPRKFDPRSGFFFRSYQDYATPIEEPLVKRFIARHRLKKKNPQAEVSEAVEPIIYYVDRGAPEPVRSALIEGASWWNQAFEAAGYRNAFQVKVLPEGVDPLDVRYNVIQWVHRSTRGWSYGASVSDPRTGEIIKGHVSLGSLRVRQDFLIAEGLLGPYQENEETGEMLDMSLARLRQLSAHEVGHTIGLSHNFAASVNDRASVMDYPHPTLAMKDGKVSLANAYAVGIGAWDKEAIKFGYGDGSEADRLKTLDAAFNSGLRFITDQDARPTGSAHAYAHLWDNGKDAASELQHLLNIRKQVLATFTADRIKNNTPYTKLEEALVPMYFLHRYQVEAASKMVGGLDFNYGVKGHNELKLEILSADKQQKAIEALLQTISVEHLKLPEALLRQLPPRAFGYRRGRETFKSKTGVAFDAISPAETIADVAIGLLLHPQRANRLLEYHSRNAKLPSLDQLLEQLINQVIKDKGKDGYEGEIQRVVAAQLLSHLMSLAVEEQAHVQVQAIASWKLKKVELHYQNIMRSSKNEEDKAYSYAMIQKIEAFRANPDKFKRKRSLSPPDGSPIGSGDVHLTCGQ